MKVTKVINILSKVLNIHLGELALAHDHHISSLSFANSQVSDFIITVYKVL